MGVDLVTLGAGFGVGGRPLSVILVNDNGTPIDLSEDFGAFLVGSEDIPDAGVPGDTPAGWADDDFLIPSAATALPAGWSTFDAAGHLLPGTTWGFQGWYRGPPGPCWQGLDLSNGLLVTFAP